MSSSTVKPRHILLPDGKFVFTACLSSPSSSYPKITQIQVIFVLKLAMADFHCIFTFRVNPRLTAILLFCRGS